jgi:hypothetical protein
MGSPSDSSAKTDAGVIWSGEYNTPAGRREKAAFAAQLTALGYSHQEFRVTVERAPLGGVQNTAQRYTVLVVQLWAGVPYRGKRYIGGHGADWVSEFSRDAPACFPQRQPPECQLTPITEVGGPQEGVSLCNWLHGLSSSEGQD